MRMSRIRVWRPSKKLRLSQVVSMGAKKGAPGVTPLNLSVRGEEVKIPNR